MTHDLLFWMTTAAVTGLALAFALPRLSSRRAKAALVFAAGLPAVALGIYALQGDGIAPEPRPDASSPATEGNAAVTASREELVRHLDRNTRDGRAWILLARIDFESERYADAAVEYEKALAASPKVAADAGIWCEYADAVGMAQGGSLAGRPRELVARALAVNPAHPKALEMAGSAAYEQRDFAATLRYWRTLLPQLPVDSSQHRELAAAIARVEGMTAAAGAPADAAR